MCARRVELSLAICAAIAAGLVGNAAIAAVSEEDDTPAKDTAAQQDQSTEAQNLEGVVVTAQKRKERLIDVPMSIAATSGKQLTDAGISSTLELQQATPGVVTVNNGLGFVPVIRGVSSSGTAPGDESNVAIYMDGVYIGTPIAGFFDLADIERVEILKGPQGTLFGRNATGGAISIVTRTPSFTPEGNFSADYGFDYNETKLSAFVTGPLSDQIAGSLSATYRSGDGYIDGIGPDIGRTYGKPDNYVVRGKLLFLPTDTLSAMLAVDSSRSQNNSVFAVSPPEGINPYPLPGSVASSPYHYAGSTQPEALVEGHGVSLDATWDALDSMTVRSITAYRKVDGEYQSDLDRTSLSINALELSQYQKNFSQEFNFSSPSDQALTWLAGAYYYKSTAGNPYWTVIVGADAPDGPPYLNFTSKVETTSYAGFGDTTWNATDKLHFTVGARYTSETKEFHYQDLVVPAGGPLVSKDEEQTWDSPTYRGVIRYDFMEDANVYASWSNGFKSGVYDAYSKLGVPVDPEKIDAIEVGAKARVNGITFTAAAYNYDYKDIQVQAFATLQGAIVLKLTNAAKATMRGLEFTADGKLTEHLSFNAGVNWMPTAKYGDFKNAQVTIPIPDATGPVIGQVVVPYDASGSRITKAPKWTSNLRMTYTTPLWDGQFAGTLSGFYNPGFYWQPGNLTKEPAYGVLNMRLSWTDPRGQFTYSLWGTNLTNSNYSTYTVPNVRGNSYAFSQERQVGIGVAVGF